MQKYNIDTLTDAFKEFNNVVAKFQTTYDSLQEKINLLNLQIEKKNKQLEAQISEGDKLRNFLNNILENIYSGVIVIDKLGRITVFNQAAENITGFDKEEVLGKKYHKVFPVDKNQNTKSALYTLTTGKVSHHRNKCLKIKGDDTQSKSIEFSTSIIKDDDGNILGVVEVFNDVSEFKKLEDKVTHIETLAALGEMAANVAHEIRNPLGAIYGYAGLLNREISNDDPKKEFIKPIMISVDRLNNTLTQLLTFAKPMKINSQTVNLINKIDEYIDFFKLSVELSSKKIKISFDKNSSQVLIDLDVQLFQQVFINILKNAFDSIDKNGIIEISIIKNEPLEMSDILEAEEKKELKALFSNVEILIKDNGSGIPKDIMSKLFNPFFTTKEEGNGLGLSICRKILQLHKGDIHVESEEKKGTTIRLILPLYKAYE